MTKSELEAIVNVFVNGVKPALDGLRKRIAELEAGAISYQGTAQAGQVYSKGMFVTHDGSLWHCNYKTISQPGHGAAWTLAMQRKTDPHGL